MFSPQGCHTTSVNSNKRNNIKCCLWLCVYMQSFLQLFCIHYLKADKLFPAVVKVTGNRTKWVSAVFLLGCSRRLIKCTLVATPVKPNVCKVTNFWPQWDEIDSSWGWGWEGVSVSPAVRKWFNLHFFSSQKVAKQRFCDGQNVHVAYSNSTGVAVTVNCSTPAV